MASFFEYKVFNKGGAYIASCKHIVDAAAIVSANGDGSSIRYGHRKNRTLWVEGAESQPAGVSYDFVAQTADDRLHKLFPGVDQAAVDRAQVALEETRASVRRILQDIPR